jgi:hypothetical protein
MPPATLGNHEDSSMGSVRIRVSANGPNASIAIGGAAAGNLKAPSHRLPTPGGGGNGASAVTRAWPTLRTTGSRAGSRETSRIIAATTAAAVFAPPTLVAANGTTNGNTNNGGLSPNGSMSPLATPAHATTATTGGAVGVSSGGILSTRMNHLANTSHGSTSPRPLVIPSIPSVIVADISNNTQLESLPSTARVPNPTSPSLPPPPVAVAVILPVGPPTTSTVAALVAPPSTNNAISSNYNNSRSSHGNDILAKRFNERRQSGAASRRSSSKIHPLTPPHNGL